MQNCRATTIDKVAKLLKAARVGIRGTGGGHQILHFSTLVSRNVGCPARSFFIVKAEVEPGYWIIL
jgi:hypothetical protein